jgi:hypothetical protein
MRSLLVFLIGMLLGACASTPKVPAVNPATAVIAVVGVAECGDLKGVLIVTRDGKIHPEYNLTDDELAKIVAAMPPGNAGVANMTDECAPKQST